MFLKHWLRNWREGRRSRNSITDDTHWDVHGVDFYRFFDGLAHLLPPESTVGLAQGVWPKSFRDYLVKNGVPIQSAILGSLPREFTDAAFLPVDQRGMADLTKIINSLAEPEVAIHIVAVNADRALLEWYDLPNDPVAVAGIIGEDEVARFAKETGGRYERAKPGV